MRQLLGFFILAAVLPLSACKSSSGPEVCAYIRSVLEKTGDFQVSEENFQRCLDEAASGRSEDPEMFQRIESCILAARTLETMSLCGF